MKSLKLLHIFCAFFLISFCQFSSISAQQKDLNYFLNQARINSPLLNDYQNQIQILGLDSAKLRAGLLPQVSASSNLVYAPIIKGVGYDPAITNGQLVSSLITVSKEISTKARLNTLIKGLQLSKDSLGNQRALSILDIEKSIATQYITILGDQEQLNLAKEILNLLKTQDNLLKKLTQSSVFRQTEYLTFKVSLEQQLLNVMQNQNQYKNDFMALNYLSGITDTTTYQIEALPSRKVDVPGFENSPIYEKYSIDSARTVNSLNLLALNYRPKLNVFTDGGYQSSLPKQAYKNFGWSAGLNLTIPIYDGGLKKLSINQINLNRQTQSRYRDFYKIQYQQQKIRLQQTIKAYDELIVQAKKQLSFSKTLIDANALQLKTGDVNMSDYLLSVNNYLNLRVNIIQNKINQLQSINQLHYFTLN